MQSLVVWKKITNFALANEKLNLKQQNTMSCFTENTLVIGSADKAKVDGIFEQADKRGCRISGSLKCVFDNGKILVYVYDCNGDSIDFILDGGIIPLLQETCYGKRDMLTYRFNEKKKGVVGTRYHIPNLIKKYIQDEVALKSVRRLIAYSI